LARRRWRFRNAMFGFAVASDEALDAIRERVGAAGDVVADAQESSRFQLAVPHGCGQAASIACGLADVALKKQAARKDKVSRVRVAAHAAAASTAAQRILEMQRSAPQILLPPQLRVADPVGSTSDALRAAEQVMMTTSDLGPPTPGTAKVDHSERHGQEAFLDTTWSAGRGSDAEPIEAAIQVIIEIDVRRTRHFEEKDASGQRRKRSSTRRGVQVAQRVDDAVPAVSSVPDNHEGPAVADSTALGTTEPSERPTPEGHGFAPVASSPVHRVSSRQRSRAGGDLQQRRLESVIPRHVLDVMQGCDKPRPRLKAPLANGMQLSPRPRRPPVEPLSRSVPLLPTVEVLQALLLMENRVAEESLRGAETVNKAVAFNRDMKSAIQESRNRRSAAVARVNERTAAVHSRNMRQLKASQFQETE